MRFSRQRLAALKAAAVVLFLALTANQWIAVSRFHGKYYSFGQPEFDLAPGQRKYNETDMESKGQKQLLPVPEIEVVNEIIHRAFFGLGHRFHRSAAVYHLAQSLSSTSDSENIGKLQDQPPITHFRFHWESCLSSEEIRNASSVDNNGGGEKEYNVFRYLFGDDLWKLNDSKYMHLRGSEQNEVATKRSTNHAKPRIRRNMIVLRNDVPGYIAGQLYKDLKLPVNRTYSRTNKSNPSLSTPTTSNQYEVILDKVMRSDVQFYRRLVDNYKFKEELREFQIRHKWNERPLVIGLHLRAGNGEGAHFMDSGRASSLEIDESTMISRLLRLTNMAMSEEMKRLSYRKIESEKHRQDHPLPLLFIATDTAHLLPLIENTINLNSAKSQSGNIDHTIPRAGTLEILTWPQDRLPKNAGVTFDALQGKGERCLHGWRSSMSDALLLSQADVLIAAKRSTFTQSLPLTLGFDRNENSNFSDTFFPAPINNKVEKEMTISRSTRFSFCEVSETDLIDMTCFADARTWLFRGEDDLKDHGENDVNKRMWSFSIANSTSTSNGQNRSSEPVEHKLTVLLPDVVAPSEFIQAREFLRRENTIGLDSLAFDTNDIFESVFSYGRSKINKKYRNHKAASKTNTSWDFVSNANP